VTNDKNGLKNIRNNDLGKKTLLLHKSLDKILLHKRHIFRTLVKLSKGPTPLEDLREWFDDQFSEKSFDGMIKTLLDRQFIFILQFGFKENYVLLLKDASGVYLKKYFNTLRIKSVEKKIKSIMEKESTNELTIGRKYLLEIFNIDLIEFSKHDGLPTFKPFIKYFLYDKGISTQIFGNIIKLKNIGYIPEKILKFLDLESKEYLEKFKDKALKSPKATRMLEKEYKINKYITLKLEDEKTQIYVNGKRFFQCMRLFLQIPPQTRHLYEEVETIDEAAEVYNLYFGENRIIEGLTARVSRLQDTTITPEQEFWAHCSNLQTWVEHEYDTRLLICNVSFPLLKKLTEAGDPLARKVFKEEIAQRLESGYPSVVQYLLIQRYLSHFTPIEFKTIIDTTNLIKIVSAQVEMLSDFLQACANSFPFFLGDIVLKILELPEGKQNLITASSRKSWVLTFRVPLNANPKFLDKIKYALIQKLKKVRKDKKREILDYIQIIDDNVSEKK